MEPHSVDGTQRLELPVSRTTLKSCGGVPMAISEKSRQQVSHYAHQHQHGELCDSHWAFRKLLTGTGWLPSG